MLSRHIYAHLLWKMRLTVTQVRVLEECYGFEPSGHFRNHGLASRHLGPLGQHSGKTGPCSRYRTCDLMLPKHARYQLRHTRVKSNNSGRGTRSRTADNPVKSRVLYLLSYAPRNCRAKRRNGAPEVTRTPDIRHRRPQLYPLSYRGKNSASARAAHVAVLVAGAGIEPVCRRLMRP